MASWLEVNDHIYNKKLNAYKDFKKKDALWESKEVVMDKDVDILNPGTDLSAHALPTLCIGSLGTALVSWQKGAAGSLRTLPGWGFMSSKLKRKQQSVKVQLKRSFF